MSKRDVVRTIVGLQLLCRQLMAQIKTETMATQPQSQLCPLCDKFRTCQCDVCSGDNNTAVYYNLSTRHFICFDCQCIGKELKEPLNLKWTSSSHYDIQCDGHLDY